MRKFKLSMVDQKELTTYEWDDVVGEIKGVIQLVHGSCEHMGRYSDFGKYMNKKGYIVIGADLRGHGLSANLQENELGFFAKKNGWKILIDDQKFINNYIKRKYVSKNIFMFGHSMGSFLARSYAIKYSETINGLILCGNSDYNSILMSFSIMIASVLQFFQGAKKESKFIWKNSYKSFDKKYRNNPDYILNTWLTRNKKVVEKFNVDPLCGQIFATSTFKDMFQGLKFVGKKRNINLMKFDLPILMINGEDDPVGSYMAKVDKLYQKFLQLGYDVELISYPEMRHEILNELDNGKVKTDILQFLGKTKNKK